MEKRVIPVSPNTFYVYLQTILFGLKGLEIERSAQEIIAALARLRGDFARFGKDFRLIGTHMHNATRCYDSADRRFELFKDKLEQLEITPKEGLESPSSQSEPEMASTKKETDTDQ